MEKRKDNPRHPKKTRRRLKSLLCAALLLSLCASTLSFGSMAFADQADGNAAAVEAESEENGSALLTAAEAAEADGSTDQAADDVNADEAGSAQAAALAGTDAAQADETGTAEAEGSAETGMEAAEAAEAEAAEAEDADSPEESGEPSPEAEEASYPEEADAELAEADDAEEPEEEPAGAGHDVILNQSEGGTLSFADGSTESGTFLAGDTVTVHVDIDTNSPVLNTNIYTAGGERIDAQWNNEDEFFFLMPDEDVAISPDYYGMTNEFSRFEQSMEERRARLAALPQTLSSEQGYYLQGQLIYYAGWNTRYRTVDGNEAYCVQPSYGGPANGWYDKHYNVEDYITASNPSYAYQLLKTMAWFSYGSPGFDKSYWPSTWYDGTAMTSSRYYVLAHIEVADIYSESAYASLYGTDEAFRQYVYENVTGYYADGTQVPDYYEKTTRGKVASTLIANGRVAPVGEGFDIFILYNNGYQDILSFEYTPPTGTDLTIYKYSTDTDLTENSSSYSLAGAIYYAYEDEACTVIAEDLDGNSAKFITTASGKTNSRTMEAGTYYVKETTASKGFTLDPTVYEVTLTDESTGFKVTSRETPMYGYIELTKSSDEPGLTDGNPGYSLAGANYGIYSDADCTSLEETIATDSSGCAKSGKLALGTYYVREITRPEGYKLDSTTVYEATIDGDESVVKINAESGVVEAALYDLAGLSIRKSDAETGLSAPQGDAELSGAQFTIRYYSGNVSESSVAGATPTRIWVIETKKTGSGGYEAVLDEAHLVSGDKLYYDSDGSPALPLGTYTIQETRAPAGYRIEGTFADTSGNTVDAGAVYYTRLEDDGSASGQAVWLQGDNSYTQSETPLRGGVKIQKRDLQSGRTRAEGGATLAGAVFEIVNESDTAVQVDGTLYQPGEVVLTLVTDEDGCAETDADALPYGTYRITETQQPAGYLMGSILLDAVTEQTFEIREDGVIVDLSGSSDSFTDQVKRADFSFEKQDGDNQSTDLGSVKFRLTSETTGESHIFWTDPNGQYSSASDWEAHTQNTNAGETFEDGLWFYGYADWEEADLNYVDDRFGALPYDTYLLEELPCEGNEGRTLITTRFTVYGDNVDLGDRANVHLGTIDNYSLGYVTTAADAATGEKYLAADESAGILDEISYWGLERSQTYRFVTELYDVTADDMIRDADGNALSVETEFTPHTSEGTKEVPISFDATGLEGHTLVVFEYLYDENGNLIKAETDASEEEQTIRFTGIGTTLVNDRTGEHQATILEDAEICLTDTVSYKGLIVGETYVVRGILMDRETGGALLDADGVEVRAESEPFLAESSDGEVTLTFRFFAGGMQSTSTVAFEYLYEEESGVLIARHADLENEGQTVELLSPTIRTNAAETDSGKNQVDAEEEVDLTDQIELTGLIAGHTYYLYGRAVDPDGNPVCSADGDPIELSAEFTADAPEMQLDFMTFRFDASGMDGQILVFEEFLFADPDRTILIVSEEDPDALEQTVFFNGPVTLGTTLLDESTGTHEAEADGTVTLIDTVAYEGLTEGESYQVTGVLMDASTGEVFADADGHAVTAQATFIASSSEGIVEVPFEFKADGAEEIHTVAYEYLYNANGRLAAAHTDLGSEEQSVVIRATPVPEEQPPVEETPESPDTPEVTETPVPEQTTVTVPEQTPIPAAPGRTGDVQTTAWLIVVSAAAASLILGFSLRKRSRKRN